MKGAEQKSYAVGVVHSHLMNKKTCFLCCQMTAGFSETIPSFLSILVISSPASSVHPVIVSDWSCLSPTTLVTISVGGVERRQFDYSVVSAVENLKFFVSKGIHCICRGRAKLLISPTVTAQANLFPLLCCFCLQPGKGTGMFLHQ